MYVFHMYYVYDVFDDSHYIQKTVPAKCTLTVLCLLMPCY